MANAKIKRTPKKQSAKRAKGAARRSPKETKAESVEVSTGVQLLLGNGPPDKDLLHHYENVLAWEAKKDTVMGHLRAAKKVAKEAGCDLEAMNQVKHDERMEPQDLANRMRQYAQLGRIRGLPVQTQLFEPKYGSIEEQAKAEGFAAGKAGRSADGGRWKEGEPGYEEYLAAWTKGQASHVTGAEELTEDESEGEE